MKLRELLNTCQTEFQNFFICYEDIEWENDDYPTFATSMGELSNADLNGIVDAWAIDSNFNIYVLLTL